MRRLIGVRYSESSKQGIATLMNVYLSITDLAERLGVSVSKLNNMRRAHQLPKPVLVGKDKRWLAHEIDEWFSSQRAEY